MKANKNMNNSKNILLGIQLLSIIFSFHMLVFHCINKLKYKNKIIKYIINDVSMDLCTFFIMSFYFSFNFFSSSNILKMKNSFKSLLIPYIVWPIIFFMMNFFTIFKYNMTINHFKYLYYQLVIGNGIHLVFWFLFNMMFMSLFFSIIIFLSKKSFLMNLFLIGIIFYLLNSYLNYSNFFSFFHTIIVFPISPIISSYFYSLTGFYFFFLNITSKLSKYKMMMMFLCLLIMNLYMFCKKSFENVQFICIIFSILCSVSLLILFLFLPFSKMSNTLFGNIMKQLSKYSGGMYYIHTKVHNYLNLLSKEMSSSTMFVCMMIYLISNIMCFMGLKLFSKSSLSYLFM